MKADPPDIRTASPEVDPGWRRVVGAPSLPEAFATVPVSQRGFWRKLLAFSGPGLLVSVGYMDPGNWATDLEGGSRFGYTLLSVVFISNLLAMLLQHLALKLGIVSGRDLAQACRDHYSRPTALMLWLLCEVAIGACDLAEVIGSAIALQLLFGLPLVYGVLLTGFDVLLVLFLQNKNFRSIEFLVVVLIAIIGACFGYELLVSRPDLRALLAGFVPTPEIASNPKMLYIAIAIMGATVMPHNLYLHSSIVQTRAYERSPAGRKMAIRFATLDSCVALFFAFFVNAAILVLSAATFNVPDQPVVAKLSVAYKLLLETMPQSLAATFFAVALLASGLNSTLTGTMAGQIVMEGFLELRLRPWVRRLITRLLAIVPAVLVAAWYGEQGEERLLILSQVVLSLQLSFAVVPLVMFTCDRQKMGRFVNPKWLGAVAWLATGLIVALNVLLLIRSVTG
jgi:manganese transport protein